MPALSPRTAVVGLQGPTLRYAEVAAGRGVGALRRLGSVQFDDDAERALLGDGATDTFGLIERAVRDVFGVAEGEPALGRLVVAAHPSHTISFATPLPQALSPESRHAHLTQEAGLLADLSADQRARIEAVPTVTQDLARDPALAPEPHRWYHVLHVDEAVHARLTLLARVLGTDAVSLVDSTRAAAAVVAATDAPEAEGTQGRQILAIGLYGTHTEVALVRDGVWAHGHHGTGTAPEDTAYFGLAALDRLGVDARALSRLFVYGDDARPERSDLLAQMLDLSPEPLDALSIFGRRPTGADAATLAAFAPVLGAALAA